MDYQLGWRNIGSKGCTTKWRAIIDIETLSNTPTDYAIELNAHSLARYAKIAQDFEMVPIVLEVIMDGDHNIETCYKVTSRVLFKKVFNELEKQSVYLNGILLKPNMIVSGKKCNEQASVKDVSDMTLKCLSENVPSDVPAQLFSFWRAK